MHSNRPSFYPEKKEDWETINSSTSNLASKRSLVTIIRTTTFNLNQNAEVDENDIKAWNQQALLKEKLSVRFLETELALQKNSYLYWDNLHTTEVHDPRRLNQS